MRSATLEHGWARSRHALIPAAVALSLCVPGLRQGALATDTAWYTAIAVQSWQNAIKDGPGSLWSLLGVAGRHYFNKPPLGFWLNGAPIALLGPSTAAARLGSVLACVLCVLAAARLGRLLGDRAVGLASGMVLALTWEFVRHSHAFSLDLWMTLFLTLAACSVASAVRSNSAARVAFAGLWIGLALMVKPLVPLLALPLLGLWLVSQGRARWLRWLLVAGLLAMFVAAPWHVSMRLQHGAEFTNQYFGREVLERAAAGPVADFNKGSESPTYYLGVLLSSYWPWLLTLAVAGVSLCLDRGRGRHRAALLLALAWSAGWLVLLSVFPDKRPRYLLVIYPVAAVASALVLVRVAPPRIRELWRVVSIWALPVCAAAAVVVSCLPVQIHRKEPPQWERLYAWIRVEGSPTIYAGGLAPQRSAQVYLATGAWPAPTRTVAGERIADPPAGAFVLYHRRDGLAPGRNETVVFSEGDLIVTRLNDGAWAPMPMSDPGE